MIRKWFHVLCKAIPIVLVLALAGCGGSSSDSTPQDDTPGDGMTDSGGEDGADAGDDTSGDDGSDGAGGDDSNGGDDAAGGDAGDGGDTGNGDAGDGGDTGNDDAGDSGNDDDDDIALVDTDSDGQIDSHEQTCGSDPNSASSISADVDGDDVPDCVDLINDVQVTEADSDGDGQTNDDENTCGSDPNSALSFSTDTNEDGTPDCVELATPDPDDSDGDGQVNADELACGSDPENAESMSPDGNDDNRPDCLGGFSVLPITGSAGESVDCMAALPCTWINDDNTIRIRMTYADSRDSSINENEQTYLYEDLAIMYEVYSDVDTDLTFLDSASFSDVDVGVSEFRNQRFLNIGNSFSYGSEVVSLLAGTSTRVLTTFNDGVKGQGSIDELTLPFLRDELRFEAVFEDVHFGRVYSLDKDCQNLLPCTWVSPDGTTDITLTALGLTNLADLKAELSVVTRRDGVTLTLVNGSRGVGSDLSTYTGYSQRFDQVNDLSTSLVNAAMVNGESRTATVVFNESPNSTLDRLARLSLDLFETIPQSPNYEENTSNWNRYRVVHTPRLDPVFRNIPLTQ